MKKQDNRCVNGACLPVEYVNVANFLGAVSNGEHGIVL